MRKSGVSIYAAAILTLTLVAGCKKDKTSPPQENRPPVANAGDDRIIYTPVNAFVLDASNSFDPDGDVLQDFNWSVLTPSSKVATTTAGAVVQSHLYVSLVVDTGVHTFQLQVRDPQGLSSYGTVNVTLAHRECQSTSEVIVEDQTWVYEWWGEVYLYISPYHHIPPGSNIEGFYIRRDGSEEWDEIITYDSTLSDPDKMFYSFDGQDMAVSPFFGESFVEDTPDVKIIYCSTPVKSDE